MKTSNKATQTKNRKKNEEVSKKEEEIMSWKRGGKRKEGKSKR